MKTKKRGYEKKEIKMRKFDIMLFWNKKGWRDIFICKSAHKDLYKSFFDDELRDCLEIKTENGWNSKNVERLSLEWFKEILFAIGRKIKSEYNVFIGGILYHKIKLKSYIRLIRDGYNPFDLKCGYEVLENKEVYICRYKEYASACSVELGKTAREIPKEIKTQFKKMFKEQLFYTLQNGKDIGDNK